MHVHHVAAAFAAAFLMQPLVANAEDTTADAVARTYFARACADHRERVAVYAPDIASLSDITTGATGSAASWDSFRFERLCAHRELRVYHCHTTEDVLSKFPSGSKDAGPGDFGTAAEMEFTCAKVAAVNGHPVASLVHGLVTQRGEVVNYGFTRPTLDRIHEQGRSFGRMLKDAAAKEDLARVEAEAQASFNRFNAEEFDSFIAFAIEVCPNGDIEHCSGLTVERFASALPRDDWRFIRVADAIPASPAGTESADRDQRISEILDRIKAQTVAAGSSGPASADRWPSLARSLSELDGVLGVASARAQGKFAELTPETLGAFIADGRAMVSICAESADGLLPCERSKARMNRLAAACDRVKIGVLDQDKYPQARYIFPVARDRSLLLFKTNPQSGLNEHFEMAIGGEPTPQMIGMVLCDRSPLGLPSFGQ